VNEEIFDLHKKMAEKFLTSPYTGERYSEAELLMVVGELLMQRHRLSEKVSDLQDQLKTAELYMSMIGEEGERESARLHGKLDHIAELRRLNDDEEN